MAQIKLSIVVDASPERIYPLVATAAGLSQWWAADVAESGGVVDLGFFKRTTVYRLQLVRGIEPREAEWRCLTGQEWDGTRLLFSVTRNNGTSLVRFTHADWKADTDYFVSCTTTWGELMYRLKATAEGKAPGPLFSAAGWRTEFHSIAIPGSCFREGGEIPSGWSRTRKLSWACRLCRRASVHMSV